MKLLYGICGSFCCHQSSIIVMENMISSGHNIVPIISQTAASAETRFGSAGAITEKAAKLSGHTPLLTIPSVEKTVTGGGFDAMVIVPCTGNTLSKIASGATDGAVTMGVKAMLRNQKPIIIAFASNDGLSCSLKNVSALLERKNFYFVPMRQDDYINKPSSLVCDFSLTEITLSAAMNGRQIQPILLAPLRKE